MIRNHGLFLTPHSEVHKPSNLRSSFRTRPPQEETKGPRRATGFRDAMILTALSIPGRLPPVSAFRAI